MKEMGYGKDYKYAHDYPDHIVAQEHLPENLKERKFYDPSLKGYERQIRERLDDWERKKAGPPAGDKPTKNEPEQPEKG
jgi:putative ATPase